MTSAADVIIVGAGLMATATACLLAEYAACPRRPTRPPIEALLTMEPLLPSASTTLQSP
jgi:hypothetical protein